METFNLTRAQIAKLVKTGYAGYNRVEVTDQDADGEIRIEARKVWDDEKNTKVVWIEPSGEVRS